jgi:2-polyprenyl-3-methyl-5-hydroxy-6-metoxy-1,4-benzoquinol methylase
MPTIEDVREFWDSSPLWTGESGEEPGSKAFFDSHTRAVIEMAGGQIKPWMMPACAKDGAVLDLGCGIGFWLENYGRAGFSNLTGADLSQNSLSLAKRRCELNGIDASLSIQNAEAMTFANNTFDHINCCGVIHHSPNPPASINEIYRVLKPGGTAVIGVYYKNALLRMWPILRAIRFALPSLKGRGRERMLESKSVDELVRLYDGNENPIGVAFSRAKFEAMLPVKASFHYSSFPSRILPIKLSGRALGTIERMMPFMISAVIKKRIY